MNWTNWTNWRGSKTWISSESSVSGCRAAATRPSTSLADSPRVAGYCYRLHLRLRRRRRRSLGWWLEAAPVVPRCRQPLLHPRRWRCPPRQVQLWPRHLVNQAKALHQCDLPWFWTSCSCWAEMTASAPSVSMVTSALRTSSGTCPPCWKQNNIQRHTQRKTHKARTESSSIVISSRSTRGRASTSPNVIYSARA